MTEIKLGFYGRNDADNDNDNVSYFDDKTSSGTEQRDKLNIRSDNDNDRHDGRSSTFYSCGSSLSTGSSSCSSASSSSSSSVSSYGSENNGHGGVGGAENGYELNILTDLSTSSKGKYFDNNNGWSTRQIAEYCWLFSDELLSWTNSKIASYSLSQKLFRCVECACVGLLSSIAEHWLGTHANVKVYQCSQCAYASAWARCLRIHLAGQHNICPTPSAFDQSFRKYCRENPALEDVTKYLERLKYTAEHPTNDDNIITTNTTTTTSSTAIDNINTNSINSSSFNSGNNNNNNNNEVNTMDDDEELEDLEVDDSLLDSSCFSSLIRKKTTDECSLPTSEFTGIDQLSVIQQHLRQQNTVILNTDGSSMDFDSSEYDEFAVCNNNNTTTNNNNNNNSNNSNNNNIYEDGGSQMDSPMMMMVMMNETKEQGSGNTEPILAGNNGLNLNIPTTTTASITTEQLERIIMTGMVNNDNNIGIVQNEDTVVLLDASNDYLNVDIPSIIIKRYNCEHCNYTTDRRDLFTRHENIHRDDKPYECNVCHKQFNRADHIKKHFLRLHPNEKYNLLNVRRDRDKDSATGKKRKEDTTPFFTTTTTTTAATTTTTTTNTTIIPTKRTRQQRKPKILPTVIIATNNTNNNNTLSSSTSNVIGGNINNLSSSSTIVQSKSTANVTVGVQPRICGPRMLQHTTIQRATDEEVENMVRSITANASLLSSSTSSYSTTTTTTTAQQSNLSAIDNDNDRSSINNNNNSSSSSSSSVQIIQQQPITSNVASSSSNNSSGNVQVIKQHPSMVTNVQIIRQSSPAINVQLSKPMINVQVIKSPVSTIQIVKTNGGLAQSIPQLLKLSAQPAIQQQQQPATIIKSTQSPISSGDSLIGRMKNSGSIANFATSIAGTSNGVNNISNSSNSAIGIVGSSCVPNINVNNGRLFATGSISKPTTDLPVRSFTSPAIHQQQLPQQPTSIDSNSNGQTTVIRLNTQHASQLTTLPATSPIAITSSSTTTTNNNNNNNNTVISQQQQSKYKAIVDSQSITTRSAARQSSSELSNNTILFGSSSSISKTIINTLPSTSNAITTSTVITSTNIDTNTNTLIGRPNNNGSSNNDQFKIPSTTENSNRTVLPKFSTMKPSVFDDDEYYSGNFILPKAQQSVIQVNSSVYSDEQNSLDDFEDVLLEDIEDDDVKSDDVKSDDIKSDDEESPPYITSTTSTSTTSTTTASTIITSTTTTTTTTTAATSTALPTLRQSRRLSSVGTHSANSSSATADGYNCSLCDWTGTDKWSLRRHMNTHSKPFQCSLCEYKAARSERLQTHVNKMHHKVLCTMCKYTTASVGELLNHQEQVHGRLGRNFPKMNSTTCSKRSS